MTPPDPRRSRWIPWLFVAGMSLVVAVNGVLVYFATREPVGIVVRNPYVEGLRYGERLAERDRQAALGWQVAAGVIGSAGSEPVRIRILVSDSSGTPLSGLKGRLRLERPIERLPPIEIDLNATGEGEYAAAAVLPRAGQWEMTVDLVAGSQRHSSSTRIMVP